jgi:hypothetical protein
MTSRSSSHRKPLVAVRHALKSLLIRSAPQDHSKVNPVDEVREGLKDIKAGRVRVIKSARELLNDE